MLLRHQKLHATPQDQGFTRPTVLVLLPFRSHALAFIKALLALLPPCYEQVENKARFVKEYDEDEGSTPMPLSKPEDYRELFEGNNDDCFRCSPRHARAQYGANRSAASRAHHGALASPQVRATPDEEGGQALLLLLLGRPDPRLATGAALPP